MNFLKKLFSIFRKNKAEANLPEGEKSWFNDATQRHKNGLDGIADYPENAALNQTGAQGDHSVVKNIAMH